MTEADWLACGHPGPLLEAVGPTASDRKLRLYCCACCRRFGPIWNRMWRMRRRAVEAAELGADGRAGWLQAKTPELYLAYPDIGWDLDPQRAVRMAVYITASPWTVAPATDRIAATELVANLIAFGDATRTLALADLVREVFQRPGREAIIDQRWRTADVVGVARGIYDDRAFDRMPVLADALMDAGCEDEEIISHCRGPNQHVRGCRVVDLVLGQS